MSNRTQIDSVIDDDDEFWYGTVPGPALVPHITDGVFVQPSLHRRVRYLGQEL